MRWMVLFIFLLPFTSCRNHEEKKAARAIRKSQSCIERELDVPERRIMRIKRRIHADEKVRAIDSIFRQKVKRGFNGNVLIAQKDAVIYEQAFGMQHFKRGDTLTTRSAFQLASLTKTFTATAALLLKQQGRLELTDTVQRFFADFPYKGVTIEDLLTHRSGLPNYLYVFDDSLRQGCDPPDNQTIMCWFAGADPVIETNGLPDRGFSYNNTNYMILAAIIEKVTGLSYGAYLKKAIFDPLGMEHTWVVTEQAVAGGVSEELLKSCTVGYEGGREIPKDFFDGVVGDKGIYSTVRDLYRWYIALNSECLLEKDLLEAAFTPRSFERPGVKNYGYGFRMYIDEDERPEYLYHNGWWKGYSSLFWFSPNDEFIIIMLANRYNKAVYDVRDLLDVLEAEY